MPIISPHTPFYTNSTYSIPYTQYPIPHTLYPIPLPHPPIQGYSDEPLDKILMHVDEGPVVEMDRWQISVWPNDNAPRNAVNVKDSVDDVPIHVINNYFSIGADAQVTLEFHLGRGTCTCTCMYNMYA